MRILIVVLILMVCWKPRRRIRYGGVGVMTHEQRRREWERHRSVSQ